MNSAEGGTFFFCFLLRRLKAITAQTMRSKAAPVTPIAIAVTFNDLPGSVVDWSVDVCVGELALAGEGVDVDGREGSVKERNVDD